MRGGCSTGRPAWRHRRGQAVSAAEESLARVEQLLERLEAARARLESTEDPENAIETLGELQEIAREVEAELTRARKAADAGA